MNPLREAAQQPLEALEEYAPQHGHPDDLMAVLFALRAALAQQVEPVQVAERERVASQWDGCVTHQLDTFGPVDIGASIRAGELVEAPAPEPDVYGYASRLAVAIWEKHYKDTDPQWKPLDDIMGVLTQIDNLTSGLTRLERRELVRHRHPRKGKQMTLTPWFPGDTCPYRVGVYQRDFGRERKYAYWTGLAWRIGNAIPEGAEASTEFSPVQLQLASVRWRGLVEPAQ